MLLRGPIKILRSISPSSIVSTCIRGCFKKEPLLFSGRLFLNSLASVSIDTKKNEELNDTINKIQKDAAIDLKNKKVFVVVHIAGSQFKVAHNDVLMINQKIAAECGDLIKLEKVLAIGGRNFTLFGQPLLKREMVNVEAMVMEKTKGEKKHVFKKKKRKGYKRWKGHRQDLSVLKIKKIDFDNSIL